MTTAPDAPFAGAQAMRDWARGDHPLEAGMELLVRSGLAQSAALDAAWGDSASLDVAALRAATSSDALSRQQRSLAAIAMSLLGGSDDAVDLPVALSGLDRASLELVLAALAHAAGSHEHIQVVYTDEGIPVVAAGGYLPPARPWPAPAQPV